MSQKTDAPHEFGHPHRELLILHDVFDIPTNIIEYKLTTFVTWGRPVYGTDLALYWAWQALNRVGHNKPFDLPISNHDQRLVFIAKMLGIGVQKLLTDEYHFILNPVRKALELWLVGLFQPDVMPAKFQTGDWAWHLKKHLPVLILTWHEDRCSFLLPIRTKNQPFSASWRIADGPFSDPGRGLGEIGCTLEEFDHEPDFIVPIRLDKEELPY